MAEQFMVDAQVAAGTATELTQIRTTVNGLAGVLTGQGAVTGSARVSGALDDFVADSSDARERMDGELERAAGMLSGLATGATTLDSSLATAVTIDPAANPTPGPGVQPTAQPVAQPTAQPAVPVGSPR
jgi:hypothetical protein